MPDFSKHVEFGEKLADMMDAAYAAGQANEAHRQAALREQEADEAVDELFEDHTPYFFDLVEGRTVLDENLNAVEPTDAGVIEFEDHGDHIHARGGENLPQEIFDAIVAAAVPDGKPVVRVGLN